MTIEEFKKNIAPYMRKGWVAMDTDNSWWWFDTKPSTEIINEQWINMSEARNLAAFTIEPVEDWTKSLIEVGK